MPHAASVKTLQSSEQTAYAGVEELRATAEYLKRYSRAVVRKLARYATPADSVLEFGAGIGTLAKLWQAGTGVKPDCLEIDAGFREILVQESFHCFGNVESVTETYDYIYSSNVLEHIEDDVHALRQIRMLLNGDGCLALYVPAFMCLYSEHDVAVGHYRRYGRKELAAKLDAAGFRVMESCYDDCVGFFASLVVKLMGYPGKESLGGLRIYDTCVYPFSAFLDRMGCRYLFGKNILIFAKKK